MSSRLFIQHLLHEPAHDLAHHVALVGQGRYGHGGSHVLSAQCIVLCVELDHQTSDVFQQALVTRVESQTPTGGHM